MTDPTGSAGFVGKRPVHSHQALCPEGAPRFHLALRPQALLLLLQARPGLQRRRENPQRVNFEGTLGDHAEAGVVNRRRPGEELPLGGRKHGVWMWPR